MVAAVAGEAVVVAPTERGLAQAVAFARTKGVWIAERLAVRPQGRPLEPGQVIALRGRPVRLEATPGAGAARLVEDGAVIRSGGEGEAYARRIENFLKREARQTLVERTDFHLRTLGQKPVKVSIADTRSRWGSCSPHNRTIRYSWRVIMAPPPVIDYLAAHEVAHLIHADHGPRFWQLLQGYPSLEKARGYLDGYAAGRGWAATSPGEREGEQDRGGEDLPEADVQGAH